MHLAPQNEMKIHFSNSPHNHNRAYNYVHGTKMHA